MTAGRARWTGNRAGEMKRVIAIFMLFAGLWLISGGLAAAGEADVVDVRVTKQHGGSFSFDVAVRHADAGWKHYADGWRVVAPDGTVLGTRTLLHPHDNEQPFTRSLTGVRIPDRIGRVTIRAHEKVHGWGGKEITVELRP